MADTSPIGWDATHLPSLVVYPLRASSIRWTNFISTVK